MELLIVLVSSLIFYVALFLYRNLRRPANFPPGPRWYLPFIGNTSYLKQLAKECGGQHKAFEKLSEMYNSPVIGLKLGNDLVIVVLTYPNVKEVLTREEFDGRPDNFFLRLRTMGTRLGITCTDGPLWNEHRSFVVRQLKNVGYGKTKMDLQIQDELKELNSVIESSKEPIWPADILPASVINVLWTFTTGSRIKRSDARLARFLDLLHKRSKAFDMAGGSLSQMPWIRFFAPEKSGYNLIRSLNKEFSKFFMEIINEHHNNYSDEKSEEDLIFAFIREMKNQADNPQSTFTNIQLAMIILDIFIAGSQTTSITLDLALMMMLIHPDIQEKCHQEIDKASMGDNQITYNDRQKFPYIEAFLLEVQRYFHIVPICGPRRVLKDTKLDGFDIPYNTTVLIGLRSVHMDKDYWKNPDEFYPERFLNENMEVINSERLIPFGLGRRRCLGDVLARSCIFTFFTGILRNFNLRESPTDKPSLNLLPGITLSPKKYKIVFEKR